MFKNFLFAACKGCICMILFVSCLRAQSIPTDSMYLAQPRPGLTPRVFSLPVEDTLRTVERIAFTNDGKELYFSELDGYPAAVPRIRYYKYASNKWQGPFNLFFGFAAPRLSPNDSIMFMQRDSTNGRSYAFISKRTAAGWTNPAPLMHNISSHYPQLSGLNHLFCSTFIPATSTNRDLARIIISGTDTTAQGLGAPINTANEENDFFIAKDESYILFCRNGGGQAGDMYITYNNGHGGWTNPKLLDQPISTPSPNWEYGPFVSADGKYLFFTRGGNIWNEYKVYWIQIDGIIDSLRHTNFEPYLNHAIPGQNAFVGKPFSYTLPDSTFIDDDGNNTLTYKITMYNGAALPSWLKFNAATRTLAGTPLTAATYNLRVVATDSLYAVALTTFTVTVTNPDAVDKDKFSVPRDVTLQQNYPNPFNPETTITFSLPQARHVQVKIFTIDGREVSSLINGELKEGEHKIVFNGKNLSSGIYVCRLQAGTDVIHRQMLLLK